VRSRRLRHQSRHSRRRRDRRSLRRRHDRRQSRHWSRRLHRHHRGVRERVFERDQSPPRADPQARREEVPRAGG
jgi:hypothetical protein